MAVYKLWGSLEECITKVALNKTLKINIGKNSYCLARTSKGIHFTDDACPHLGESLSKGNINHLGEIVCPWHSYRFNVQKGQECEQRCSDLRVYNIEINDNGVFVHI